VVFTVLATMRDALVPMVNKTSTGVCTSSVAKIEHAGALFVAAESLFNPLLDQLICSHEHGYRNREVNRPKAVGPSLTR
jgi:hypothetical protein